MGFVHSAPFLFTLVQWTFSFLLRSSNMDCESAESLQRPHTVKESTLTLK
jgi:hypothetical protein